MRFAHRTVNNIVSIGCPFRSFELIQAKYTLCDGQGAYVLRHKHPQPNSVFCDCPEFVISL